MAIELTARAKLLSQKRNIEPNLILEIDGIDTIFSNIITLELARYGENNIVYGQEGLVYGGGVPIGNNKDYISLTGNGPIITQQLQQDRGSVQSVSSLNIELIDKNQEISRLVAPGVVVDDILGKRARCYLNFKNGVHPDDSILIHRGIIDTVETLPASVRFNIAHPEGQKRQDVFIKRQSKLDKNLNQSHHTVEVISTEGFLLPYSTEVRTFVRIDDEIIEYTGLTATSFTGCTRGALGTIGASHDKDADVVSFYQVEENAMDFALKFMMSDGPEYFVENVEVTHIGAISPSDIRANAILFSNSDIKERYGLVVGDKLTITGSLSNNVTDALITGFGKIPGGESYVLTNQTFTAEFNSDGLVKFKTKYNVWPDGLGMTPEDVDVDRHEQFKVRFNSLIPEYRFYFKDTIEGKSFISEELYFPGGFYSLPRKAKASVGITLPPISDQIVPILDTETVTNPSRIKGQRSIVRNYYNAIVYRYDEAPLEESFGQGKVGFSSASVDRFDNIGNKVFTVTARGLRDTPDTEVLIRNVSRRILERYEFAAQALPQVNVLFKTGFNIEVGDIVVFGDEGLKVVNLQSGDRATSPELFEVVNKSLNLKAGDINIKLDLLATAFEIDGRYVVIGPASKLSSGSTTTALVIKDSFSTTPPALEQDKWTQYINETILVRSPDYSFAHETKLIGFSDQDPYVMIINPPLPSAPLENYIVDVPNYPTSVDPKINEKWKLLHCSFDPQVAVTGSTGPLNFSVASGDVGKFFVGSIVRVHNFSYSKDSPERVVTDITGLVITVDQSLGFTPNASDVVDLIGFPDEGLPYRIL